MLIRLATYDDIPELNVLFTDFFEYNAAQQPKNCIASKEDGQYPNIVINSADGDIYVAEAEGRIIGFIHVKMDKTPPYPSVTPHKYARIVDFFVGVKYRKKGIGSSLLDDVKQWARARTLEYIELMVLENNAVGKSFYKREYFTTVSHTMRLDI